MSYGNKENIMCFIQINMSICCFTRKPTVPVLKNWGQSRKAKMAAQ